MTQKDQIMKTELQIKIDLVRKYIYEVKGVDIVTIKWSKVDNTRELQMLEQCYQYALKYYRR